MRLLLYEMKKILSKEMLICALVLLCVNGVVRLNEFNHNSYSFAYAFGNSVSQMDYDQILEQAQNNLEHGVDCSRSQKIIRALSHRVPGYYNESSYAYEYVNDYISPILAMILTLITSIWIGRNEFDSKMIKIGIPSKHRYELLYGKKLVVFVLIALTTQILFWLINTGCEVVFGRVMLEIPVYRVPGMEYSLFGGSIVLYRIVSVIPFFLGSVVLAEYVYSCLLLGLSNQQTFIIAGAVIGMVTLLFHRVLLNMTNIALNLSLGGLCILGAVGMYLAYRKRCLHWEKG